MDRATKGGCVLLADSHQGMLEAVRGLLQGAFEAVFMVADEASMINALARFRPDLVVADLSLPVAGHRNVVQRLGEEYPAVKIIVLSVHPEATAVRSAMKAGAAGYVLKWSALTDLPDAVAAVRGGLTYVSPGVDAQVE